jgi:hypothetical protein
MCAQDAYVLELLKELKNIEIKKEAFLLLFLSLHLFYPS